MSSDNRLKRGNLSVVRGSAPRPPRGDRTAPRYHPRPDAALDRRAQSVFATWKTDGTGAYASRGIADAAHAVRHPCRALGRRFREAAENNVPQTRVEELCHELFRYVRSLYSKDRSTKIA